ncbi:MAG: ATP-dependent zinc protease [Xanthomonadales bacterium]
MPINSLQCVSHCFAVILLLLSSTQGHAGTRDLEILGWVENVLLIGPKISLKAKLDTGAETSSLDAEIIKKFRKNGKRWVRFRITDRQTGKKYILVRQRVRTIGVIQHDGSTQTRPVVLMNVCIARRLLATEVSLVGRSEFNYPLLLGRNTLKSFALVDPGNTFLSDPECNGS